MAGTAGMIASQVWREHLMARELAEPSDHPSAFAVQSLSSDPSLEQQTRLSGWGCLRPNSCCLAVLVLLVESLIFAKLLFFMFANVTADANYIPVFSLDHAGSTSYSEFEITGPGRSSYNLIGAFWDEFPVIKRDVLDGDTVSTTNDTYHQGSSGHFCSCHFQVYTVVTRVVDDNGRNKGRDGISQDASVPNCNAALLAQACLILYMVLWLFRICVIGGLVNAFRWSSSWAFSQYGWLYWYLLLALSSLVSIFGITQSFALWAFAHSAELANPTVGVGVAAQAVVVSVEAVLFAVILAVYHSGVRQRTSCTT